ncbi:MULTISPECIES: HpcH/HpaI aldolase family protein [unclassified Mesorhizobium]|uniref:HpcH/HpaI aldolase family protein n=1 Tax=unclassified Mesorhizobium TaxID=325217 RepID=UPI00112C5F07|nr:MULTISPECIES: HpcH/HpaI aldolase/citrate lyase family protein [unclassified Mesorhizobium]MBZ9701054.1 HpcH/HpaI aldolase/citrate lyase family protein [Mesorhizobium sp. CO1-1-3]MBZ9947706.1 HpcH/HpaI aldolase/citrate lyase family protein [Mesorhizobium sp. BR1-1-11]TPJ00673.1 HpcH/HpaI aldolase/citrate lyase family protein [Mesorhizobium sp. B2-8-1]TPN11233.1 HpcH/HpaI aldolase/citrate lyase family protein [Mesorhizobium sp. B2-1-3]
MSGFRNKCIGRESLVGSFAAIPHPVAVEVMAQSGLDFLCIDWEHAQISRDMIETMVRAADIHRVPAIVRVPGHAPEAIAAALDSGAQGVLVPRVSTAAQAQAAVKASRYPPTGERGVGPGRAAGYGYRISEYLAQANDSIVVAVQVETSEGLANIEAIAAVEGVDVIFVGPGDLSVSIDAIGPKGADKLAQAIRRIIDATIAHGRTSGIFCAKPQDVAQWATLGASFFILASDTMFLGAGAAAGKASADAELGRSGRS